MTKLERAERKNAAERVAELEAELAMPPFPKAATYLWRTYLRLRRRCAPGFAGPVPVSWQDIDAFIKRSGLRLDPWEIEIIETLDNMYLKPEPEVVLPEGQTVNVAASADDAEGVRSVMSGLARRRVVKRKKGG